MPLFIKQTDVLQQDLMKSRSQEIQVKTLAITLKSERHRGGSATAIINCQITERHDPHNIQYYRFETSRNLAARRLNAL